MLTGGLVSVKGSWGFFGILASYANGRLDTIQCFAEIFHAGGK
jgi:hypothetical protein